MNILKHLCGLAATIILACSGLPVAAQEFGVLSTLWTFQATNNPAIASNIAASVTVTRLSSFSLDVTIDLTNASTGSFNIQWDAGNDGVNWGNSTAGAGHYGWFAVQCTNAGTSIRWCTNITMGSVGYWRANWITNLSVQHATNISIKAYGKTAAN